MHHVPSNCLDLTGECLDTNNEANRQGMKVAGIGRKAVIQAAHVMADMALDLMKEPKLLQAAKDEFTKRTEGKKYVSLNVEPAPPGGRLDHAQKKSFDCVIHTVMEHFGIGGPGPIAGADALRD